VCLFPRGRREGGIFVFVSRVLRVGEWMGEGGWFFSLFTK